VRIRSWIVCALPPLLFGACAGTGTARLPSPTQPVASRDAVSLPTIAVGKRHGVTVYRTRVLSPVYTIDKIYRSMMGPESDQTFTLLEGEPEVVWIVGYHAVMRDAAGVDQLSDGFMCHSNLALVAREHREDFPTRLMFKQGRLFTLSQGQLAIDFPPGFGIPVMSDQKLYLTTQVLNHNVEGAPFDVRHDISVDFVLDRDLEEPLIPLIQGGVSALKMVEGEKGYFGLGESEIDPSVHGQGCLLGEPAPTLPGMPDSFADQQGRRFTGFWLVEPGIEENHSLVTNRLYLAYDTTIHYIAVHLHPFAESLELRDLTTGETLFKSRARQAREGIGLEKVEYYSSVEGIPIYTDHEYELVSVYNNTSGVPQDSMATVLLFLRATDLEAELHARRQQSEENER